MEKKIIITFLLLICLAVGVQAENCADPVVKETDCNLMVLLVTQAGVSDTAGQCDANLYRPDYSLAFQDNELTHWENGIYYINTDANFDVNGTWVFSVFCIGSDENSFNSMDFLVIDQDQYDQLTNIEDTVEEVKEDTANIRSTVALIWNEVNGVVKDVWTYAKRTLTEPDPFPTPLTTEQVANAIRLADQQETTNLINLVTMPISVWFITSVLVAIFFGLAIVYLLSKMKITSRPTGVFKNEWVKSIMLALAGLGSIGGLVFTLTFTQFNLNLLLVFVPVTAAIIAAITHYFKIRIRKNTIWHHFVAISIISGVLTLSIVFYWALFWIAILLLDAVIIAIIITKIKKTIYKGYIAWKLLAFSIPIFLGIIIETSQILPGSGILAAFLGIVMVYFLQGNF